jgi:hypothetical protein
MSVIFVYGHRKHRVQGRECGPIKGAPQNICTLIMCGKHNAIISNLMSAVGKSLPEKVIRSFAASIIRSTKKYRKMKHENFSGQVPHDYGNCCILCAA